VSVLVVPQLEDPPYPTLGPAVCAFIETFLVHGPGDVRGQPAKLDAEKRALLYRIYEVFPLGHPKAGRRRFKRVVVSLRKGSAKTEFAAWIAACELHPEAPVRCIGWDDAGQPIGGGVVDPYIPMVAYTEEQSEDLAYGALRVILEQSPIAGDFDIGLARIMRKRGDGKAVVLASAPDARDGARTTFQHFDETHRFTLERLKRAHRAMMANIPKRMKSDAWSLETTTAPAPGEGSVAENAMEYARAVADGRRLDSDLFFFHRQASDEHDLSTAAGVKAAVLEASGPVAVWSDIDGIAAQWNDPTADRAYLRRVWLNQLVRATDRAFDALRFRDLTRPGYTVPDGALITLGFDGARYHDSTAIVGTEIATGYQWIVGLWERPWAADAWEVPADEVNAAVADAFTRWNVWRMYADPPYWEMVVDVWAGMYGKDRVIQWRTQRLAQAAEICRAYHNAITDGSLSHEDHADFARHIGNACRRNVPGRDAEGFPLWSINKERSDSPNHIDIAMAAALSWDACRDARAEGIGTDAEPGWDGEVMALL